MDETQAFRAALGQRIGLAAGKFPSKTAAADAAGVGLDQLNKYIAGQAKVPIDALYRMAKAGDIDFSWLCTGEATEASIRVPVERTLQVKAVHDVLVSLAEVTLSEKLVFPSPQKYADLVLALHDYLVRRRNQDGDNADLAGMETIIALAAK